MRKVFRVEHESTCRGPYAGASADPNSDACGFQFLMDNDGRSHDQAILHPIDGWDDGANFGRKVWGFRSLEQLRDWFDGFGQYGYDVLAENGYVIRVFEIDPYLVVDCVRQIVFDKDEASEVGKEDWPCIA